MGAGYEDCKHHHNLEKREPSVQPFPCRSGKVQEKTGDGRYNNGDEAHDTLVFDFGPGRRNYSLPRKLHTIRCGIVDANEVQCIAGVG